MAVALALLSPVCVAAQPIDLRPGFERERLLRQGVDLQALQNRLQRETFRQEQQRYRDEDRLRRIQPPGDIARPRFQRPCQPSVSGNSYLANCR